MRGSVITIKRNEHDGQGKGTRRKPQGACARFKVNFYIPRRKTTVREGGNEERNGEKPLKPKGGTDCVDGGEFSRERKGLFKKELEQGSW